MTARLPRDYIVTVMSLIGNFFSISFHMFKALEDSLIYAAFARSVTILNENDIWESHHMLIKSLLQGREFTKYHPFILYR